jgi:hypothetical protein
MTDKSAAKAALKLQERLERAEKRAAAAAERASTKAAEAASGVAKFGKTAELLERMRAALGPLGDVLGDVTGGADDLGTALEGFSGKQVALAAGAVAVVAGLAKLSGAVLDVIGNLEAYEDQIARLQQDGTITEEQVEGLREASAAVATLKEGFGSLVVIVAAKLAPVIEDLSRGIAAVQGFVSGGFEGMNQAAARFNRRAREIKQEQDRAREQTEEAENQATANHESRADRRITAINRVADAQKQLQQLIDGALLQEADARERIALQYQQQIDQVFALMEQHPQLAGQAQELIELYQTQRDAAIAAFDAEERRKQAEENERQNARLKKQIEDITAAYEAQQQAMRDAQAQVMQATAEAVVSIVGDIESSLASVAQMFDTSTEQGKKAARNMAAAQRALAIFQIGINLAQAIGQSLAQGGPVAGAALAAAVSSAFAGLIATVSRPIPQFHTGRFGASSGMLTDERMTGGVMTVAPEVVIPPDLVSRSGGADGVRSRLEDDRPMIVQAVIDLTDERIVLPLSRALGARERGRIGIPLGRT